MIKTQKLILLSSALLLCSSAFAQSDQTAGEVESAGDSLELTIMLMPENAETPDSVTRVIELPARAAAEAAERTRNGATRANEAQERRVDGQSTAEQAREGGREFGQAMRELAQENRENAGRGGGRPDTDGPRNVPGPPNSPGAPAVPGPPSK